MCNILIYDLKEISIFRGVLMIKNGKRISLFLMVPTVVISSNVTANAMVGIRSFGNSVIGVASKLIQSSKKSSSIKSILTSKFQLSVDHNKVAKSVNLYNEDKNKFLSLLIENPRELPLKEAIELVKTPKISLKGYYFIKDENSFYPIVIEDNSSGPVVKVPKGVMTQTGFKGKSSKDNGMFEVVEVESRKEINVKNLEGTDEKYEHMSSIISDNLKNITTGENIADYDENEKGLLRLAAQYSRDIYKLSLNKPEDFMAHDNTTHRNAFTLFSASFANDSDPDFNNWLRENYIYVMPNVKKNLKLISEKLIRVKSKSDSDITTKLESISVKDKSSQEEVSGAAASISSQDDESKKIFEAQGARPKFSERKPKGDASKETTKVKEEDEGFKISRDEMHKSLKANRISQEDEEEKVEVKFHGKGYFKVPKSEDFIERDVYKRTYEQSGEKVEEFFVKQGEKEIKVFETSENSKQYAYILSGDESEVIEGMDKKIIIQAINRWGVTKQVIPQKIKIDDGTEKIVAYQIEDKLWREVIMSSDGNYYLGSVVKYDGMVANVVGKLRKLGKIYTRYLSPVVSGASGVGKAASGMLNQ